MTSIHFPDDLINLQAAWLRTYTDLARQPTQASTTTLRRRLIALSCDIAAHPFWAVPGRSPAAQVELRHRARARAWVTAA
ncbi:hypothetical protein OG239_42655 (plasmid) [Streptomyces sp. NBC_00868]|uniref:hypothetical protein n=1 Tax=Streptomyces sp. NBC_00868 TaxID=2903683 RepID=UPI002F90BA10|nr:hypothetical protein OG239_42655 [Streptomyces sp. NBC_00868]